MATAYVTCNSSLQVLFTTPGNVKGKITSVVVNDYGGLSGINHNVTIQDTFLPSASNGVASPVSTTQYLISIPVTTVGSEVTVDERVLKDKETFGVVSAIGDSQDSGCQIYVDYHFYGGEPKS